MADQRRSPLPGLERRKFLGYLLAAPTLAVAARIGMDLASPETASAAIPSLPEPADLLDLGDALTLAASPTSNLIALQLNRDDTVSFALPRAEVGQGITTTIAMLIAEELDMPLSKVHVSLADARPELVFNQLTGGSNSVRSMYHPVRTASAIARARLLATAAAQWGVSASSLSVRDGVISSKTGKTASYGSLAEAAASSRTEQVTAEPKAAGSFKIVGTPQNRIDAHDAVTGKKQFTMDLQIPNALPAMVCRPPTINGTVKSVQNLAQVKAMPGITDVAVISSGVAVRGKTMTHCMDAVRALEVAWGAGSVDGESDATVLKKLKAATLPMAVPPVLTSSVDAEFTFAFASNSALETNCAVADVRPGSAEVWAGLKSPITTQEQIATMLGMPVTAVKVHVMQGGGSFGRKLFGDAALEAAEFSKKIGKPVKLMWHRTDDFRHGRAHPMSLSRVRVNYALGNVVSYEQRHTSVTTDFGHGLGEILTAVAAKLPVGDIGFSQTVFELSQAMPYDFGVTTQLLNEVPLKFHTGSMRNVYSPNVVCARELIVDQLAAKMGQDPLAFRRSFFKNDRYRAVLDKVAQAGQWGRKMPAGMAQGIGFHAEYKSCCAVLVEIDCRPSTVNRKVRDGVTGPRVTKAVAAVDAGLPINPRGLEAQMLGCLNDGIGLALTESLHIDKGLPLEGSWDNFFYTRQWNTPPDTQVFVMPANGDPGGAGELGVAASLAAVACAYGRAVGKMPTSFPINHGTLSFEPLPRVPSIPDSPVDGLSYVS
ncbi:molybdopterin-dependent oxidoreductase [Amycolatopsis acidiphila]|uniref:Xanthine dehydrogenase family protein molybdopterin-binding subunit n=1 Tax=Amycolatopsis acidiphila TaxID=715473 RepID=A0A558A7F0_9PSEU|nr:molybdopterin cofactor-binding domain-containing protein [Amycolatopsis acidiphila]TVT20193.1 xanthine dehydrogenase family protein molybdopterin-binding subunit [Amycolatopsis acidiphila]UIJ58262.1 molybdopterin-dependent oxidoreductase [Amycolatopsis acidiphila]GHG69121.1 isoquinoline 1-oxidoreductase subunit beta [Amycolatopsis acidiphila]